MTKTSANKNHGFGDRLRDLRKGRGWTQAKLAESSGLTRSHVSRLEGGDIQLPSKERLHRLAASLSTSEDDLLTAAGYRQEPLTSDNLPDLAVYLRIKYDLSDPRALAAIEAVIQSQRTFNM